MFDGLHRLSDKKDVKDKGSHVRGSYSQNVIEFKHELNMLRNNLSVLLQRRSTTLSRTNSVIGIAAVIIVVVFIILIISLAETRKTFRFSCSY